MLRTRPIESIGRNGYLPRIGIVEGKAAELRQQGYYYQDSMRRLEEYARKMAETGDIDYPKLKQANDMYKLYESKIKKNQSLIDDLYTNAPERTFKMKDVIQHDELFKQYPELKDYEVVFTNQPGSEFAGRGRWVCGTDGRIGAPFAGRMLGGMRTGCYIVPSHSCSGRMLFNPPLKKML